MTLPGLCARHAQDGGLRRRRSAPTRSTAQARPPRPGRAHARAIAAGGALLADPGRRDWSTPCRTSPTTPMAAPSRPSTGSCRRSSPRRSLIDLGLDLKAIRDKHTNLNAQEIGDAREPRQGLEALRAQPRLRRGRGRARWPPPASQRLADMQLSDGGWGWFSGFGERFVAAHDGPRRPRSASRPPQRPGAAAQACSNAASTGSRATRPSRSPLLANAHEQDDRRTSEVADNLDALVFMVLADAGACATTDDARLPLSRPHAALGLRARRCSAWRCRRPAGRRSSR